MADIALVTANRVNVLETIEQMTLPCDEDIAAGATVRLNTATGQFTKSNGSAAGEARTYGIATRTVKSGMPLTAIRRGVMDGWDLSGLAYDADVYQSDTDGRLGTVAGTVSKVLGRVIPATAVTLGTAYDKVLLVEVG